MLFVLTELYRRPLLLLAQAPLLTGTDFFGLADSNEGNSEVLFLKEVFLTGGLMLVMIGAASSGKWFVTRLPLREANPDLLFCWFICFELEKSHSGEKWCGF